MESIKGAHLTSSLKEKIPNTIEGLHLEMSFLAFIFLLQFISIAQSEQCALDQTALNDALQKTAQLQKDLDSLCKLTQDPKAIFQSSLNSLFTPSDVFQGRRYWLSKTAEKIGIADAQAICQRYGGYLAEINTKEEFTFLKNFVSKTTPHNYVMTGGTDSMKEGEWINRYSLTTMTELNWAIGQPDNNNNEDCQCFYKQGNWLMNDLSCDFYMNETSFLCEIRE